MPLNKETNPNLKTTTVIVIMESQSIIKKGTHKYINKISSSPSQYEI